ncbi:MAG: type I glyceraldehyde-3-phosphate dehydrogenase [Kiritimatiellae bacterium]|nr:type I glyceraldehyde-3-phosphate dehydrogenase [Kiritimatiellia bacterium]
MAVRVGINGFGRIGRLVFRAMCEHKSNFDIVAINDLADAEMLAYLLRHDSTQGQFKGTVRHTKNALIVNGKKVMVLSQRDPAQLPWGKLKVKVVIESTGIFTSNLDKKTGKPGYDSHLKAGAKKVIISAPAKGTAKTVVLGVNDHVLKRSVTCVSNASCTTNSLAPVVKVLHETFGVVKGLMVTCHGYTNDQSMLDTIHKHKTRARAAAINIVPTTTGAAVAVGMVLPQLNGKLDGYALRVPVPTGSITDLTVELKKAVTKEDVNAAVLAAAKGPMKGIIEYAQDPLVSSDIIHNPHSSIFDPHNTVVVPKKGRMVKVTMWYDNEWGYSNRTADLVKILGKM